MHQIHPDESLVPYLRRVVVDDIVYHIFQNDVTPDEDTVLADFLSADTNTFPITVAQADWVFDGVVANRGYLMAAPIELTQSAGGDFDAYGYFATNGAGDELLFCARFDGAPIASTIGTVIPVWPVLGDKSRFAS